MNGQSTHEMYDSAAMPAFDEFYRAINRREPFPWQSRLANHIASIGRWCTEVGIPTGLGKTACLDIAVWWLASQATCDPALRIAPTRIWWVVNRRLLIDSTFEHAEKIEKTLSDPESADLRREDREIVTTVGNRLRSIAGNPKAKPLQVIRLRGGVASRRPTDPSQPTIILSTLPMYGSRLLFRGYGSSRKMRSIDAAMAGTDSLILLDEAHLTPHLRTLCSAISDCTRHINSILNEARSGPTLVQLTATGDQINEERFTLDDEDRRHPVVRERLDAVKLLELRVKTTRNERHLAEATCDLLQNASTWSTCVVFVNTPKTARKVFSRLRSLMKRAEILLITGRMREREAERIRKRILHPVRGMLASCDTFSERNSHLIVVATQTLEVGADIDAEYLVTEQCGIRALTQRLGRLNRLGRFKDSVAVYVHMPTSERLSNLESWSVYGSEPKALLSTLQNIENASEAVSLSPGCVAEILGPPNDDSSRAPELLPGILWEWTKTSSPPEGEAPVEPYFSGIKGAKRLVTIIWRAHVPEDGQRLWPRARNHEAIDVPIGEVRDVLKDDLENGRVVRLGFDGITVEGTSRIRPGDKIVLPTSRGLMDAFGWNPESTDWVEDVSLMEHGLPLDAESIKRICGISISKELLETVQNKSEDSAEIEPQEHTDAVNDLFHAISQTIPFSWVPEEWNIFIQSLDTRAVEVLNEVPRLQVMQPKPEVPSDDLDERSLAAAPAELESHSEAVAALAGKVCTCLGIPSDLTDVVERASRLHDIGKADQRFQRWLNPDWNQGCALLAKSDTPRHQWEVRRFSAGWPLGGRHEALSARLVRVWLDENPAWGDSVSRDLLVHLIISHHGEGRPLIKPVDDNTCLTLDTLISGKSVSAPAGLGIVDWEQPCRFNSLNSHFGPWGLALLEAILRLSDHAVSSEID